MPAFLKKPVHDPDDALPEPSLWLRRADRAAFAEVFRAFYAPLMRYAERITGDAASASDVLQDVFLKLWEDRATLTVKVSLKALLYTMVRNRALNQHRRTRRIATDVTPEEVLDQRAQAPAPEQKLDALQLQAHLHQWISELPTRRAEAFALSRYHGLKHSEIAAIMGVSVRTVDTHILLALRELRHRLDTLQDERHHD